ncbi:hypothetical protein P3G55_00145 [Leptospira sp. 96542]|nr:hypothetical protein [Leptospira sp. 96542]
MSLQTEIKLPWPEIRLEYFPTRTVPQPIPLDELWPELRKFFSGEQVRFANYLFYLSTDFSGGINLCSVMGENISAGPFRDPVLKKPSEFPEETLLSIWEQCSGKKFDELDREDLELVGFGFLYTSQIDLFGKWVEFTKFNFGLTDDCKRFLHLLGWEKNTVPKEHNTLHLLVELQNGNFQNVDFVSLVNSVVNESHWQLSGIIFDLITKGIYSDPSSFVFWKFLVGFFDEWKDWEKQKFLSVALGKIPAFSLVRYAKKYISNSEFPDYLMEIETVYRGEWQEETEFGYELKFNIDPLRETMERYNADGDLFFNELKSNLKLKPYSYFINLQLALVHYAKKEDQTFLDYYKKSGKLQYLPLSLTLYANVLNRMDKKDLAQMIEKTLSKYGQKISLPNGWE